MSPQPNENTRPAEEPNEFTIVPCYPVMTDAEADARHAALERAARWAMWERVCPALYAEPFDPAKSSGNPVSAAKVLGWQYGPRGLYILGETGKGKSRAVGNALGRVFMFGRSVLFVDGVTFALEAGAAMSEPAKASAWAWRYVKPDVLWIDDIAKRWTSATEEAAYMVLEQRTSRRKPVVLTNNYHRTQMLEKAHERSVMETTLRRIADYCDVVIF